MQENEWVLDQRTPGSDPSVRDELDLEGRQKGQGKQERRSRGGEEGH